LRFAHSGGPMSAADAQAEPTMEEILASIRRIISEDDAAPAAAPEPVDDFPDEVLELTDPEPVQSEHVSADFDFDALPMDNDPPAYEPVEELIVSERFDEPEPVAYAPQPEPVYRPAPAPAAEPRTPPRQEPQPSEYLVGDPASNLAANAFSRLNSSSPMPGQFTSGNTVEALVAELLRPMLKSWLDANLPRIVEEKVEAEVARVRRLGL
jgi:uncharacterized protein